MNQCIFLNYAILRDIILYSYSASIEYRINMARCCIYLISSFIYNDVFIEVYSCFYVLEMSKRR